MTTSTYSSLGFEVHVEDNPGPSRFWKSPHTCLTLLKGLTQSLSKDHEAALHDDVVERELIAAAGCEDGSIWLVNVGSLTNSSIDEDDDTLPVPVPFADAAIAAADMSASSFRKDKSASPALDLTSSPVVPSVQLSHPVALKQIVPGQPSSSALPHLRSRAVSSPVPLIESRPRSRGPAPCFLPATGLTARPQLTSAVTGFAAAHKALPNGSEALESLAENAAQDELAHPHMQQIAAYARSGLPDVLGKVDEDERPKEEVVGTGIKLIAGLAGGFAIALQKTTEDEYSEVKKQEMREEKELKELEYQATEAKAKTRSPSPLVRSESKILTKGTKMPTQIQIVPPNSDQDPIVSLCNDMEDELLICLSSKGQCILVDSLSKVLLDVVDLEANSSNSSGTTMGQKERPRLSPHLTWKGISTFEHDEHRYVLAYALPPIDVPLMAESKITTIVILLVQDSPKTMQEAGRFTLPGLLQVGVMKNEEGPPTLIAADKKECRVIPLLFGASGQQTPLKTSRSHANLAGFWSAAPSRPASPRAGSTAPHKEEHRSLGQLLGKRFRRLKPSDSAHEKVQLGTSKVVKTWTESRLTDIYVSSKGLVTTWRGSLVEIYRSSGSTLHPYPQTLTVDGDVIHVLTSAHDSYVFLSTSSMCEVYMITSRRQASKLLYRYERAPDGDLFAMLGQDSCRLNTDHKLSTAQLQSYNYMDWKLRDVLRKPNEPATDRFVSKSLASQNHAVLIGDSTGSLCKQSFRKMLACAEPATNDWAEDDPDRFESEMTSLKLVTCPKTGRHLAVAGDQDGVVRFWNIDDLSLAASLSIFTQPVRHLLQIDSNQHSQIAGDLLVISQDGVVAVIDMTDLHLLYLVPGSRFALERMLLSQDDLVLAYSNGKSRVWNLSSKEFRRSTSVEAAEEMLADRSFTDVFPTMSGQVKAGLHVNLEEILSLPNGRHGLQLTAGDALSVLHTFGLDEHVDRQCERDLNIPKPMRPYRLCLLDARAGQQIVEVSAPEALWQISPRFTATLQLLIVSLLRPMMDNSESEAIATQIITFYVAILPDDIGPHFQDGDLSLFAWYYSHSDPNIHQAARLLFDSRLSRLPDEIITALTDAEIGQLPVNQPKLMKESSRATFAFTFFAGIALRKYQLLSSACLKDISSSILYYLKEGQPENQLKAIEFCAKGFQIWQSYVDPSDMLRALFGFVVAKEDSKTTSAVISMARFSVLKLATTASALFITTLSMDVIDAETIAQRENVMKLCVFISRKKPQALFPNLPRLAEAVVKSLDPTRVTMRESIQQTATVILNELVKIFPDIDFAGKTQKLAVGTHEGAVIMYDIKTATRMYVLEAHMHQVSALSFSPDGRRLVTVSVDEHKVTVWKVGSSFGSFFVLGGPPRQGSGPGEPFKVLEFAAGLEGGAETDPATGLPKVTISWPGERSARLVIGQMKLTFAT